MDVASVYLHSDFGTEIWSGDVVIAGGSCAALAAAQELKAAGKSVCILEPGPSLGRELSLEWDAKWPGGALDETIRHACKEMSIPINGNPDLVGSTIAFDDFAAAHGIAAFVKMQPVEIAFRPSGMLMGVVAAGKSGRQVATAPIVVDATPGRNLARRLLGLGPNRPCGASLTAYIFGCEIAEQTYEFPEQFDGLKASLKKMAWENEGTLTVECPLSGDETSHEIYAGLYAKLLNVLDYLKMTVAGMEKAVLLSVATKAAKKYKPSCQLREMEDLRRHGIYVLPEEDNWVDEVKKAPWTVNAAVPGKAPWKQEIEEVDYLFSSELESDPAQDLPEALLPTSKVILHEGTDVVLAGMGCSGAYAALSAAEMGVKVNIIDPLELPGGISTVGRIHCYYHGLPGGLQDQLDAQSKEEAKGNPYRGSFHPEFRANNLLNRIAATGNATFFTGHIVFGVIKEDNRVTAIITAAEDGYHVFPCVVAIDCTGDADVAAAAGAKTILGRDGDGFPQQYSYTPAMIKNGIVTFSNFDAGCTDPTDSREFSRAHFVGRHAMRANGPFSQAMHFSTMAGMLGLRESRFIIGREEVTFDDFLNGCEWPSAVCSSKAHHDNHAMDYANESEWSRRHVVFFGLWNYVCHGQIPFGAFLPEGVDGLIVGGRAIGIDHDLAQLIRMQKDMQVFGEVCGVAAALSIKTGVLVGDLYVPELKSILESRGIAPLKPVAAADKPVVDLLKDLAITDVAESPGAWARNLAIWRLSLMEGEKGAFWDSYFPAAPEAARFPAALAAVLGGHSLPAAREILVDVATRRVKEPKFGIKAPAPYLAAALALAKTDDPKAVSVLSDILNEYRPGCEITPAEVLMIIKAFEDAVDAGADAGEATRCILDFRAKWAVEPFAMPLWGVKKDNPPMPFRYAFDIQCAATLASLGEVDSDVVFDMLSPYMSHPSLLIRKYARNVWALD